MKIFPQLTNPVVNNEVDSVIIPNVVPSDVNQGVTYRYQPVRIRTSMVLAYHWLSVFHYYDLLSVK